MTRKVFVSIKSDANDSGTIKEDIQIVTKSDIFKIPIEAIILSAEQFDIVNNET